MTDPVPPFFEGDFKGIGRRDFLTAMIYTPILTGAVVSFAALQKEDHIALE
jgi:hypothetical protein